MTIEPLPEFSRIIRAEQLADRDKEFDFLCEPEERQRLAKRFSLVGVERLEARVWARRIGGTAAVRARVNFVADVLQSCVVTLEPVAAHIDEWFELDYVPDDGREELEGDIEVVVEADEDDPPEIMREGAFDIGEAVSEHLALSLEDYPRKPGIEFADQVAQTGDDGSADNPFAVLKGRFGRT